MHHLDLFSGIGGFALAVDTVWPGSTHTFVDNDLFCQAILKKHWPNSTIYGDIRQFITDTERKRTRMEESKTDTQGRDTSKQSERAMVRQADGTLDAKGTIPSVGILTGGFPCQPFSHAGRRKGTGDDRYLWPEMFRVIQLTQPTWVIAENVRGLVTWNDGMVLEQVCTDLEGEGYEVQPIIIPAVAVNAPHRRDRIWFIANRTGAGLERGQQPKTARTATSKRSAGYSSTPNTRRIRPTFGQEQATGDKQYSWSTNWIEVATRLCTLDDGLPNGLARPRGWRNAALKGAGNAIVPQVAIEIMRALTPRN